MYGYTERKKYDEARDTEKGNRYQNFSIGTGIAWMRTTGRQEASTSHGTVWDRT